MSSLKSNVPDVVGAAILAYFPSWSSPVCRFGHYPRIAGRVVTWIVILVINFFTVSFVGAAFFYCGISCRISTSPVFNLARLTMVLAILFLIITFFLHQTFLNCQVCSYRNFAKSFQKLSFSRVNYSGCNRASSCCCDRQAGSNTRARV